MDENEVPDEQQETEQFKNGSPCCIYFAIDGSKEMFQTNAETGKTYFDDSLKIYHEVILGKCRWNSVDQVGLIIFSVDKDNSDPFMKNVWVMQELKCVNVDMARDIHEKCKNGIDIESDGNYTLVDALSHAQNKLASVTKPMTFKKVVLFTCQDNPYDEDHEKKHSIRLKINSFKDMDLQFEVVNLGQGWNDERFWKDIRLIFDPTATISKSLSEVVFELQKPAKIYREVQLEITEGAKIKVSIYNIIRRSMNLETKKIDAKTNEPVVFKSSFVQSFYDDDDEPNEEPLLNEDVTYVTKKLYASRNATFTAAERQLIQRMTGKSFNSDIKIMGFLNRDIKPALHFKTPYFITWSKHSSPEEKKFFAALLKECSSLGKMAICLFKILYDPKLYALIPCEEKGGFWLYQLPFKDQMREWTGWDVSKNAYQKQNEEGFDEEKVSLLSKMISRSQISISECRFKSPRLNQQLSCIQALALGEESPQTIEDDTSTKIQEFEERVLQPVGIYTTLYPSILIGKKAAKRPLEETDKEKDLEELEQAMAENRIMKCTVEVLRRFAIALGIPKQGRKAELVNNIVEAYNSSKSK